MRSNALERTWQWLHFRLSSRKGTLRSPSFPSRDGHTERPNNSRFPRSSGSGHVESSAQSRGWEVLLGSDWTGRGNPPQKPPSAAKNSSTSFGPSTFQTVVVRRRAGGRHRDQSAGRTAGQMNVEKPDSDTTKSEAKNERKARLPVGHPRTAGVFSEPVRIEFGGAWTSSTF